MAAEQRDDREDREDRHDRNAGLSELLNETKILLPGTEVFLGFLTTLPFTEHFGHLDEPRRIVYMCTFCATLLSLILFVMPAAYHRIARPIRHKERFKNFANRFLVAGLVPMSLSMVLAMYLVAFMVLDGIAIYLASAFAVLIAGIWWAIPLLRGHDREPLPTPSRRSPVPKRPSLAHSR